MYICVCKAITDKQLEEASKGAVSLNEVFKKLGLGSECGSCLVDSAALQRFKSSYSNTQPKDTKK